MPHILSGTWRSSVVNSVTGIPGGDQEFDLRINEATGDIEAGSTHGGNAVTGKALMGNPGEHAIRIDKAAPSKKYRGYLLVNGPQMILVGFVNRTPGPDSLEGSTPEDIAAFFDQQQEVWIATKP